MKTFETTWEDSSKTVFFMQGWEPDDQPRAVVMLIHGLGEHTGRYAHVGEALTGEGYGLTGFDLRGHGKSGGVRGHFPSLDAVMLDIREFVRQVTQRYPGIPQFLYGHSLGGLLCLSYAIQHGAGLKGVVVTGAALRSSLQEQRAKIALVKLLGSLISAVTLHSGLDPSTISRDPKVVDAYINDPLVHYRASLGLGKASLKAIDLCFARGRDFRPPLLLMHGTADRLTYASGSEDFARLVTEAGGDVTLKLWEGLYHEIHNEPQKAEVLQFMIDWLNNHLYS